MPNETTQTALLVVDMQVALFSIPTFPLHEPEELLRNVALLISEARQRGFPVIYTQQVSPPGQLLERGSAGAGIHPAVAPAASEWVMQKEQSDAFLGTDLHARLQEWGVTKLIICGLQTEYCIDTTCRRAFGLGYHVLLPTDAHSTGAAGDLAAEQIIAHHNVTLGDTYATLCRANEVFED